MQFLVLAYGTRFWNLIAIHKALILEVWFQTTGAKQANTKMPGKCSTAINQGWYHSKIEGEKLDKLWEAIV